MKNPGGSVDSTARIHRIARSPVITGEWFFDNLVVIPLEFSQSKSVLAKGLRRNLMDVRPIWVEVRSGGHPAYSYSSGPNLIKTFG